MVDTIFLKCDRDLIEDIVHDLGVHRTLWSVGLSSAMSHMQYTWGGYKGPLESRLTTNWFDILPAQAMYWRPNVTWITARWWLAERRAEGRRL